MTDGRWVLVILICLVVVLTLIDVGTFTAVKIQANNIRNLNAQMQQMNTGVNSFVSQLQRCETMKDVDKVLKSVGIERIK
jgi:hypothetical protein